MERLAKILEQLKRRERLLYIAFIVLTPIAAFLYGLSKDDTVWIRDDHKAIWIKPDRPHSLDTYNPKEQSVNFATNFELDAVPDLVQLKTDSVGVTTIKLNNFVVPSSERTEDGLFMHSVYPITDHLQKGNNVLHIAVTQSPGPTLLRAYSDEINLYSTTGWTFELNDRYKGQVSSSYEFREPILPEWVRPSPQKVFTFLPYFTILFLLLFIGYPYLQRQTKLHERLTPEYVRWWVLGIFLVLSLANLRFTDHEHSMDYEDHYAYIVHILDRDHLPLADDGLYAFRSPLFYLVAAPFYSILRSSGDTDFAMRFVRLLPIAMGLLQIEVVFRTLRLLFREKPHIVSICTAMVACFPFFIYIYQFAADETAAGLTGSFVVYYGIYLLNQNKAPTAGQAAIAGGVLGLAFLSKISTILLLIPAVTAMIIAHNLNGADTRRLVQNLIVATVLCFAVSGWYYIRNVIEIGAIVAVGWDFERYTWWQEPGYRSPAHYLNFGYSLLTPVGAATQSFWDGLYSSTWADSWIIGDRHWNFYLMPIASTLAIIPVSLMMIGIFRPQTLVTSNDDPNGRKKLIGSYYAVACLVIYFSATLYMHISISIYSVAKGSYFVAVLPAMAIVLAHGMCNVLPRLKNTPARAAFYSALACWAIASFGAFIPVR